MSRFLLVLGILGSTDGLTHAQLDAVKRLPGQAVGMKAPAATQNAVSKAASAPGVKVNPLTKEKPAATLPVLKKTDPSLRAVPATPRSTVKIAALDATLSSSLIHVTGVITHSSLGAGAAAQNCTWSMQAFEAGQWHNRGFLQGGQVSIGPNDQVTVRGYYALGANRAHYSPRGGQDWGWSLSGLDLRTRPTKFRLRVSALPAGMVRVNANFTRNPEEIRECPFGKFAVQYRCPDWQTSGMLEFNSAQEATTAGWPALQRLGFEVNMSKKGAKYLVEYRSVNWTERTYVARQEADKLHAHLLKLTGVEVRMLQR